MGDELNTRVKDNFHDLLNEFKERSGKSWNALAHQVGVDTSYLSRMSHGLREPPRQHIVDALARVLKLSKIDHGRLLVAAGYAPMETWDECLQACVDVLNDHRLTRGKRDEFRMVVMAIARQYRGGVADPEPPVKDVSVTGALNGWALLPSRRELAGHVNQNGGGKP